MQNYFKPAWRGLFKQKQFTILNLLGLSTGLACVLLIYIWVTDEMTVDHFNANDSRLYQVRKQDTDGAGNVQINKTTQGLLAESLAASIPEVEYAVQVHDRGEKSVLSVGDKHIRVRHEFAGKDFFKVFSYPLVNGNNNIVSGVKGMFVSDVLATKLFGSTDITGKSVNWNFKNEEVDFSGSYYVAGVFKAPPANASNQFDVLLPFDLYAQKFAGGMGDVTFWGSNMVQTFVVLKKNASLAAFNNKIRDFTIQKVKSLYPGKGYEKYEGILVAQKYSDAYLHNNFVNGIESGGRIAYVMLFSIIAIFILVIACINFMNLSTAKASARMKEAGVRKLIGASRRSLIFQYVGESMLMAFISLLLAAVLAYLFLPVFRDFTGKALLIDLNFSMVGGIFTIATVTGLLAGSYPALYLSAFDPASVLKGRMSTSPAEAFVRKGLVVFQFAVSVVLIISVLVVYQQMKLVSTKDLGYNKDNIITFSGEGKLGDRVEVFLSEARNVPGVVQAAAMSGDFLGHASHSGGGINWDGKDPNLNIQYFGVSGDQEYMKVLNLKMASGRMFSKAFSTDSLSVIFNESAIAAMHIKDPIGKTVSLWGKQKQIIGVVKDFHFESLYNRVGPAFLECIPTSDALLVKIRSSQRQAAIAGLARLYKSFNDGVPFEFRFLDDDYNSMYASEEKIAVLSRYFAGVAIIISCLGLFGLTAFMAQKRQKEIGIRKVVGASIHNITMMLSADFLKLVGIALLIACPGAWWAMQHWLNGFAYRINIGPAVFIISAAAIILVTIVTVSFQAIRAALKNPVISLRTE